MSQSAKESGRHHYGCSTARNKGTCENRLTVRQDELEGMVIGALQSRLMDPALGRDSDRGDRGDRGGPGDRA